MENFMLLAALPYHNIDPIAFHLGPFSVRWYSLGYIFGLLAAWYVGKRLVRLNPAGDIKERDIDDFLTYATLGVILGGRLGYVLFYNAGYFLSHPLEILKIWDGGMSFHGGLLGVILSFALFSWSRKLNIWAFGDIVATVCGFGLFLVRIANFINGELYGRKTDVPWAMYFPMAPGSEPRHPSQLYEAFLEGLVLTAFCLYLISRKEIRARAGFVGGVFLLGYGLFRVVIEFFRQPDSHLGFLTSGFTMGQWLSFPMICFGLAFILNALRKPHYKVTGYNA